MVSGREGWKRFLAPLSVTVTIALVIVGRKTTTRTMISIAATGTNQTSTEREKRSVYQWIPEAQHPCNILRYRLSVTSSSQDDENETRDIEKRYKIPALKERFPPHGIFPPLHQEPIILVFPKDPESPSLQHEQEMYYNTTQFRHFQNLTQRATIHRNFDAGEDFLVTLSSSNQFSEHRRTIPLKDYLHEILSANNGKGETTPEQNANTSWYLFGETYSEDWKGLLEQYPLPPCETCTRDLVALAFGIGNRGSGVQWHTHGPGFSQAVHGRKHWLLYSPTRHGPPHVMHKDQSSRQWMEYNYSTAPSKPYECTLDPGDIIYFPDKWWHATVNLDPYTVFVSSFTTEHEQRIESTADEL